MHKLSLWQKIGLVGLLLVVGAGLGLGIRYHDHVQADRQHQDRVYQQLDTLEKAKSRIDTEKTESGKLTALLSLIASADTYDRSQDADAKVKHQYQVAIADARKSFVKQDQANLKALTPEAKTLAKLDDSKLKKQITDLGDLKKTVKAHHKAVYSTKAYKELLAKIEAAVKTQTALLKKHQDAAKKSADDKKKAAAAQASTDANSTTDQTDTTASDTTTTGNDVTSNTSAGSAYTGSTYTGSTYGGTSTSRYTAGSRYTGGTWRPSSSSNQSSSAGASTAGSAGTNSNSSAGSTSAGSSTDNGGTDSSANNTDTTTTQPDATTDLSNGSDQ